jgi:2-C-methyl-D-erythritol 4-phosphate cytidylyltransferase
VLCVFDPHKLRSQFNASALGWARKDAGFISLPGLKKYAVIVAGGAGTRMQSQLPKQFMQLADKPVLQHSIESFLRAYADLKIILVLPAEYVAAWEQIVDQQFDRGRIQVTTGGETRFQSVKNGLDLVTDESIVFVHDAVRCLLSADLIHRCYETALETGSAIPVVAPTDSVRLIKGDRSETTERNKVVMVQTPQTFHSKILLPAYKIDYQERFTDEASVVEAYGVAVTLVKGEETNIKITRPLDLVIAGKILESRGGLPNSASPKSRS